MSKGEDGDPYIELQELLIKDVGLRWNLRISFNQAGGTSLGLKVVETFRDKFDGALSHLEEVALTNPDALQEDIETELNQNREDVNDLFLDHPCVPIVPNNSLSLESSACIIAVRAILDLCTSNSALLYRRELGSGFTALHAAFFVQSDAIFSTLLTLGGSRLASLRDNYGANVFDYARLLRSISSPWDEPEGKSVSIYNSITKSLDEWTLAQFEDVTNTKFISYYIADLLYLEQLILSGLELGDIDERFRQRYSEKIAISSGDENCFIAHISDHVGYGLFAKRDFVQGDYIIRICGKLVTEDEKGNDERDFAVFTNIETILIDGRHYRNLGALANHSNHPNSMAYADFNKAPSLFNLSPGQLDLHERIPFHLSKEHCLGVQDVILVATKDIGKGFQILWDYNLDYFHGDTKEYVDMGVGDGFPTRITDIKF